MLSEIDSSLFCSLIFLQDEENVDWYGWLHYFRLRILYNHLDDYRIQGIIFKQNAIFMLDCLIRGIKKGIIIDERIISEVIIFHSMKLCPTKTAEILGEKDIFIEKTEFLYNYLSSKGVSIVIPVRIDSIERERNLDLLLDQLTTIKDVDIRIIEADRFPLYKLKQKYKNVVYNFVEDTDFIFHRTKYLNILLNDTESDIVGIWDTDVIIPINQILEAVMAIQTGQAVMSFPYDGRFYMLSPEDSCLFEKNNFVGNLNNGISQSGFFLAHGFHSVGGAFFVNRRIYIKNGGENEHFYGWGPEDAERVKRIEILNLPLFRSKGPLYHLYHPRTINSSFGSDKLEIQNRNEFLKVCSMTRPELNDYIKTWNKTSG